MHSCAWVKAQSLRSTAFQPVQSPSTRRSASEEFPAEGLLKFLAPKHPEKQLFASMSSLKPNARTASRLSLTPNMRWTSAMRKNWESTLIIFSSHSPSTASRRSRSSKRWCAAAHSTSSSSTPSQPSLPGRKSKARWEIPQWAFRPVSCRRRSVNSRQRSASPRLPSSLRTSCARRSASCSAIPKPRPAETR